MGTKNTDLVANFEATPQVKNNAAELHGVLRTAHGSVELLYSSIQTMCKCYHNKKVLF